MTVWYGSSLVSSGGTGTFDDPLSIQDVLNAPSAGDEVRLLNDGTYNIAAGLTYTKIGADNNPITIRGRKPDDSAYLGIGEQVIIDGSLLTTENILTITPTGGPRYNTIWHNIRFTNGPASGVYSSTSYAYYGAWWDCRFDNCQEGTNGSSAFRYQNFYRCEWHNNSLTASAYSVGNTYVACRIHDGNNVASVDSSRWIDCLFYRMANEFFFGGQAVNCTFANNAKNGIKIHGSNVVAITRCVFAFNGAYGIDSTWDYPGQQALIADNVFWNNTSGAVSSRTWIGENPIQADPLFVDAANDDYRLQAQSPAIGIGVTIPGTPAMVTYPNAGAWQHEADMPGTCTGVTNLQAVDYGDDFQWVDGTEAASYTPPGGNSVSVTVKRDSLRRSDIQGSVHGVSTGDVPFVVWGIGGDAEVNATLTVGSTTYTVIEVAFRRGDLVQHRLICREQVS